MRGLTPAERAVLASLCDVAPSHLIPIEEVEPTVRALCADGRAFASWDIIGEADRREMFDATDAGRRDRATLGKELHRPNGDAEDGCSGRGSNTFSHLAALSPQPQTARQTALPTRATDT